MKPWVTVYEKNMSGSMHRWREKCPAATEIGRCAGKPRARIARFRFYAALIAGLMLGPGGCGGRNYYAAAEDALATSGYYQVLDHIAAYYPSGIALNFPGYIVGFEETSRRLIADSEHDLLLNESKYAAGYTIKLLTRTLRFNVPFISHVMRYEGRPYGEGNCSLYNIYHNHGSAVSGACRDDPRNGSQAKYDYSHAFARSWDAIDILKQRLSEDLSSNSYTHLVVGIMGLDTPQEEAIRNYRSLVSSIRRNAGSSFEPVFVGITWPSFFANRWFDPLWETVAYSPIADRADILGLSWLGVILNDVILPLSGQIGITVIAHSFGARAASMGLCVGPAILRDGVSRPEGHHAGQIDNFIGIAPAFSLQRFIDESPLFYENVYYPDYCPSIRRIVFTASSNDNAFDPIFWSSPAGDHEEMLGYCRQEHAVRLDCVNADASGNIDGYDKAAKFSYIDTSALMKYSVPGAKGSGHSDIYRPEIGRLLWAVINGSEK